MPQTLSFRANLCNSRYSLMRLEISALKRSTLPLVFLRKEIIQSKICQNTRANPSKLQKTSMTSNVHKSTQIFIQGTNVSWGGQSARQRKGVWQHRKKCILHQFQNVNDNIATFQPKGLFELKNSFQYSSQKYNRPSDATYADTSFHISWRLSESKRVQVDSYSKRRSKISWQTENEMAFDDSLKNT